MSLYHLSTSSLIALVILSMLTTFLILYILFIARYMRDRVRGTPAFIYTFTTLLYVFSNYIFISLTIYYRSVFLYITPLLYLQWTILIPFLSTLRVLFPDHMSKYSLCTRIIFITRSVLILFYLLSLVFKWDVTLSVYLALQLYLFFENGYWVWKLKTGRINALTNWDIKNAFERIDVPIWTVQQNGLIKIENQAAHRAKKQLAYYSGDDMKVLIEMMRAQARPEPRKYGLAADDMRFRFPHKTYLLRRNTFEDRKKTYAHYHLYDITEFDNKLHKLEQLNQQLSDGNQQLESVINKLDTIVYAQERIKARINMHDILGQRLAILRIGTEYMLKTKSILPDCSPDDLINMVNDILNDLRREPTQYDPVAYMNTLKETFRMINVEIVAHQIQAIGQENRQLVCQIMREAATNSVRHGQSTTIYYFFEPITNCLFIQDNGLPPLSQNFQEGSGLSYIRKKLSETGGHMDYEQNSSGFLLIVHFGDLPAS